MIGSNASESYARLSVADQPTPFRHVSFPLMPFYVRENPTPIPRSHSTAYWFVTGSTFFGIFISECQTSELHFVSLALIPNRFQPSFY